MTDEEAAQRQAVVAEAHSWLGTAYHPEGRVKGAGTDCGQVLILVYSAVGLIPAFDTGHYPFDWASHNTAERYMGFVRDHAHEIQGPPLPGDVVLWKFGRCFSHGAIVIAWPQIIHAQVGAGCVLADAEAEQRLGWVGRAGQEKPRERLFFTLWPGAVAAKSG